MLVFSKIREMLLDTLSMKIDIEEIKNRLNTQDINLEFQRKGYFMFLCRRKRLRLKYFHRDHFNIMV